MRFSTRTLGLISLAIVINSIGGQISHWLHLPIFLDSIGTILAAVLEGPIVGAVAGLVSNLVRSLLLGPVEAAFAPVSLMVGLVAGLCARLNFFQYLWQAVLGGILISFALTLVAVPIQVYWFGGATGAGSDVIIFYMLHLGRALIGSVALTIMLSNIADKVISCVAVWFIVRQLPQRLTGIYSPLKARHS